MPNTKCIIIPKGTVNPKETTIVRLPSLTRIQGPLVLVSAEDCTKYRCNELSLPAPQKNKQRLSKSFIIPENLDQYIQSNAYPKFKKEVNDENINIGYLNVKNKAVPKPKKKCKTTKIEHFGKTSLDNLFPLRNSLIDVSNNKSKETIKSNKPRSILRKKHNEDADVHGNFRRYHSERKLKKNQKPACSDKTEIFIKSKKNSNLDALNSLLEKKSTSADKIACGEPFKTVKEVGCGTPNIINYINEIAPIQKKTKRTKVHFDNIVHFDNSEVKSLKVDSLKSRSLISTTENQCRRAKLLQNYLKNKKYEKMLSIYNHLN